MKKVRIYSLKKELGLDSCTPILDACKQVGLNVKSASNTITKSQARQVAELVKGGQSVSSLRSAKSAKPPRRKSRSSAPQAAASSIPVGGLESSKQKSRKQRSQSSSRAHALSQSRGQSAQSASNQPSQAAAREKETADREISNVGWSSQYLNGNRVFALKVAGLKSARMRHAFTTYTVSFDRLSHEIQRIHRSEARIIGIDVAH
ncbi:MAG: phycobilisome linker polypeptide [Cyanobacteria bacterium P01_E01_bin.45]